MSLRERGADGAAGAGRQRFDAWREALPRDGRRLGPRVGAASCATAGARRCPSFAAGEQIATRAAGQKAMAAFAEYAPTMIGGAADLVESTKTVFEGARRVLAGARRAQRPVRHPRARDGRDRQRRRRARRDRQAVRLDVPDLLRLHARQRAAVGADGAARACGCGRTTRSGLGEDGPTHQPVEHYAALRAIPHLWVIRPADANETSVAWRVALERDGRPGRAAALAPEHPGARPRRGRPRAEGLERGGYVLWDSPAAAGNGSTNVPELILISTGAEVPTDARRGARARRGGHQDVRVVSMPCMELFEAQSQEYREEVLPRAVTARLAVEPGATHELVEVGRQRRRRARPRPLRRLGAGRDRAREARLHAPRTSPRAPARCSSAAATIRAREGDPTDVPPRTPPRCELLSALGQSVWIDYLSRESIRGGHLQGLIDDDAVVGATSNPTIFQKAMAAGDAYDEQLRELDARARRSRTSSGRSPSRTSARPATCSARSGTRGAGRDGYVSLEVDPGLAYDTLAHLPRSDAHARGGRPPEPARQDPRDEARASRRSRT